MLLDPAGSDLRKSRHRFYNTGQNAGTGRPSLTQPVKGSVRLWRILLPSSESVLRNMHLPCLDYPGGAASGEREISWKTEETMSWWGGREGRPGTQREEIWTEIWRRSLGQREEIRTSSSLYLAGPFARDSP